MTQEKADQCRRLAARLWGCSPKAVECYWRSQGNPTRVSFHRAGLSRRADTLDEMHEQLTTALWERHQLGHVDSSGHPRWGKMLCVTDAMLEEAHKENGFVYVSPVGWLKLVDGEPCGTLNAPAYALGFDDELQIEPVVDIERRLSDASDEAVAAYRAHVIHAYLEVVGKCGDDE